MNLKIRVQSSSFANLNVMAVPFSPDNNIFDCPLWNVMPVVLIPVIPGLSVNYVRQNNLFIRLTEYTFFPDQLYPLQNELIMLGAP